MANKKLKIKYWREPMRQKSAILEEQKEEFKKELRSISAI